MSGPLSWRDVYDLVNDSNTQVLGAIEALKADVDKVTDDHEFRVRSLEDSRLACAAERKTTATFLSIPKTIIITLAALFSTIISVVALVSR
jgi:hypothetical protein